MSHAWVHSVSSARKFGGVPEDYLEIHRWLDATKEFFCDYRHRALRHHAEGIFECERVFGVTILNSEGKQIPVRPIAEQHVREDCGGFIPSVSDWLRNIRHQPWMNPGQQDPRPSDLKSRGKALDLATIADLSGDPGTDGADARQPDQG